MSSTPEAPADGDRPTPRGTPDAPGPDEVLDPAGEVTPPGPDGDDVQRLDSDPDADLDDQRDDDPDGDLGDVAAGELDDVPAGRPSLLPALGAVLGLTAIICVILVALGLPGLKGGPHRVPIGLAGDPAVTTQVKGLFAANGNEAFRVRVYAGEGDLRSAISDRKIYGGLVLAQSNATMLVASGGSPTVAQLLNSVAGQLGAQAQIPVSDVVPLPSQDPRGSGLAAVGLPLVLAGVLPGWLLLYRRFRGQPSTTLAVAAVFSLVSGFAVGAILRFWFHSLPGNFWLVSLGLALGVAAVAFAVTGLAAIAGPIGAGIGTALMVLLGYPLSGLSTAPEWFSGFWGHLGQALPPGATATLLRSTGFFSGRGATSSLIVLGAWTLGGLLLVVIGVLLNPKQTDLDDEVADEVAGEPVLAS